MTIGTTLTDDEYRAAREREERRLRRNATRREWTDGRTKISRRIRAVEADLRSQLRAQGRVIRISDDMIISSLAQAAVQLEIMDGQRSHGAVIDDEQLTRLLNTQQRLIGTLGLRASSLAPPKPAPSLGNYLSRVRDRTGEV